MCCVKVEEVGGKEGHLKEKKTYSRLLRQTGIMGRYSTTSPEVTVHMQTEGDTGYRYADGQVHRRIY